MTRVLLKVDHVGLLMPGEVSANPHVAAIAAIAPPRPINRFLLVATGGEALRPLPSVNNRWDEGERERERERGREREREREGESEREREQEWSRGMTMESQPLSSTVRRRKSLPQEA